MYIIAVVNMYPFRKLGRYIRICYDIATSTLKWEIKLIKVIKVMNVIFIKANRVVTNSILLIILLGKEDWVPHDSGC